MSSETEFEIGDQDTSPAAGSQAGRPINIAPDKDTISVAARTILATFNLPVTDEQQVKIVQAQIETALLSYQQNKLPVEPIKPNSFRFYSFLTAGVIGITAGSLTLGVGDKPGTARTVLGALGIAFGTLSLTGAVMNLPIVRKVTSYVVEFHTTDRQTVQVRIVLPLGLSDVEFVQQSERQINRALREKLAETKPDPAKESFNADAKDDTINKMTPENVLDDPLATYGDPEPIIDPADTPANQDDDLAPTPSSSSSSDPSAAPVKAKSEDQSAIDAKYGSVVKTPKKQSGIGEHAAMF